MQTVTVDIERYDALVKTEARVEVLKDFVMSQEERNYIGADLVRRILGCEEKNEVREMSNFEYYRNNEIEYEAEEREEEDNE